MNENNNPAGTPKVTANITWISNDPASPKKASASITIADSFIVKGISIVQGQKGLFVSMPQRASEKKGETKYFEIAHPITAAFRSEVSKVVLDTYAQTLALAQCASHSAEQVNTSQQQGRGDYMAPPPLDPALAQEYSAVPIMGQTM